MACKWDLLMGMNDWFVPARPQNGSGAFTLRLCPARKGKKFCLRTRVHKVGDQSFQCHKELIDNKWQGECAVCDYYAGRYAAGKDDGMNTLLGGIRPAKPHFYQGSEEDFTRDLNSIKPLERYYFNIIARGEEERGPLKWSCGKTIYAAILEGIVGNPNNVNVPILGDVTHPKKGHDLLVRQTMKGQGGMMFPDYEGTQFMPTSPLGTTRQINKWVKNLHDLDTLRMIRPKEEMLVALEGVFGYLGPAHSKQVWRSITDAFEPAW